MKINLAGRTVQDLRDALATIDPDVNVKVTHLVTIDEHGRRFVELRSTSQAAEMDDLIERAQDAIDELANYNGKHNC